MEWWYGNMMKTTKIQRTKILPLRWIGNFLGEYAGNHLIKAIEALPIQDSITNALGMRLMAAKVARHE